MLCEIRNDVRRFSNRWLMQINWCEKVKKVKKQKKQKRQKRTENREVWMFARLMLT